MTIFEVFSVFALYLKNYIQYRNKRPWRQNLQISQHDQYSFHLHICLYPENYYRYKKNNKRSINRYSMVKMIFCLFIHVSKYDILNVFFGGGIMSNEINKKKVI